ncbi:uncharacterized protein LOC127803381 [Diospyros lotus]|uniref:uncharacterized protein LOC127803381 n=1 Tax=Diospyros lotus TaxID=55363 RepID=UPI0022552CEE|nr:uncharacterized protein LOC127803381 [Diospyros lotus]
MFNAIRSARSQPPTFFFTPLPYNIRWSTSGLSFRQPEVGAKRAQKDDDMAQQPQQQNVINPDGKTGDVMSHSFGEGYATRSEEEGFGGIYGGNDTSQQAEDDGDHAKATHEDHPEFDKSQGSEVAEKEKGRHQKTC